MDALSTALEAQLGLPSTERPAGLLRPDSVVVLTYYRDSLPPGAERDSVARALKGQPAIPEQDMAGVLARVSPLIDRNGLTDLGWVHAASLLSNLRARWGI